jgi:hypothetical protein
MMLAIPGGRYFSVLQEVLTKNCDAAAQLCLTKPVQAILANFWRLAKNLTTRPTRLDELVLTDTLSTLGYYDAAAGMGGVHFVPFEDDTIKPLLWRAPFPSDIAKRLISSDNPAGTITSSELELELELAGGVAQLDVLDQHFDIRERIVHNSSDNIATVWWQQKGAVSSSGLTSCLLRIQALHQRHFCYIPLHDYISGMANATSDYCSRLWDLNDSHLLAHLNSSFPQSRPWCLYTLRDQMHCSLILALLMTESAPATLLNLPQQWRTIITDGMGSA